MRYKLFKDDNLKIENILVLSEEGINIKSIPKDPANTDYQEYLKWTKASPMNVAEEAE